MNIDVHQNEEGETFFIQKIQVIKTKISKIKFCVLTKFIWQKTQASHG